MDYPERGTMKSQDDIYVNLHEQLIRRDTLELSSSDKLSLDRDIKTLRSRCSSEGLAFVTKTLPKLGRALDHALVSGRFTPIREFKCTKGWSRPEFLRVYFNRVFNEDGFLLDTASPDDVKHLRQILWFAYKLERPYSESDKARVIETFERTDKELKLSDDPLASDLLVLAKIITRKVFHDFDHKDIHPQHGPGAVATGERNEGKWVFARLFNSIHQVYPYYDYYVVGGCRELSDRLDWYKGLQRLESGSAKVVLVPKDSRGPRLISCEPLEYQWIQQGLGRKLARFLEYGSPYTRGRVNFTDQEINGKLAETSSASQQFATLDLKDASDRVSLELVRSCFATTPDLLRALEACRTTSTRLPNGSFITLNKFAPMGSALCFPVEAFIFWVVIVAAIVRALKLPLERVGKFVYVYGDDILVPTAWAELSIQGLEAVGLIVNRDKSCITGYFRESCGVDAFKGVNVTPSRLHTPWTDRPSDGACLASYVALANDLSSKGYVNASDYLWRRLERQYGKIPYGTIHASYPCRVIQSPAHAQSLNRDLHRWRWNKRYQRIEYFLPSLSSRRRKIVLDGWPRLMRDIISPPVGDPSVIVLPRSMKIKRGWAGVA